MAAVSRRDLDGPGAVLSTQAAGLIEVDRYDDVVFLTIDVEERLRGGGHRKGCHCAFCSDDRAAGGRRKQLELTPVEARVLADFLAPLPPDFPPSSGGGDAPAAPATPPGLMKSK